MSIAYCWRTGVLGFTDHACPEGALWLDTGSGKEWRDDIRVLCRRAYDGHSYLIPGVPEADDDDAALAAVQRFRDWITLRNNKRKSAA